MQNTNPKSAHLHLVRMIARFYTYREPPVLVRDLEGCGIDGVTQRRGALERGLARPNGVTLAIGMHVVILLPVVEDPHDNRIVALHPGGLTAPSCAGRHCGKDMLGTTYSMGKGVKRPRYQATIAYLAVIIVCVNNDAQALPPVRRTEHFPSLRHDYVIDMRP